MDNNNVINKPCDTCCTNIQRTLNRDDVTCFEDCYAFHEWRNGRLDDSYIGHHDAGVHVTEIGTTTIGTGVTLGKRRQSEAEAAAVIR
jgi:hypothetical protein